MCSQMTVPQELSLGFRRGLRFHEGTSSWGPEGFRTGAVLGSCISSCAGTIRQLYFVISVCLLRGRQRQYRAPLNSNNTIRLAVWLFLDANVIDLNNEIVGASSYN